MVVIDYPPWILFVQCFVEKNSGSVMCTSQSALHLFGSIMFEDNDGVDGGAIALTESSLVSTIWSAEEENEVLCESKPLFWYTRSCSVWRTIEIHSNSRWMASRKRVEDSKSKDLRGQICWPRNTFCTAAGSVYTLGRVEHDLGWLSNAVFFPSNCQRSPDSAKRVSVGQRKEKQAAFVWPTNLKLLMPISFAGSG